MKQRHSLATSRELSFLDANKITQHHLSIGETCQCRLGHVPSKTAHGVSELKYGVDSNVEKLENQCCISMHNDLIRRVKDGKRVKVGSWIFRHLASIHIFHAILNQDLDASMILS